MRARGKTSCTKGKRYSHPTRAGPGRALAQALVAVSFALCARCPPPVCARWLRLAHPGAGAPPHMCKVPTCSPTRQPEAAPKPTSKLAKPTSKPVATAKPARVRRTQNVIIAKLRKSVSFLKNRSFSLWVPSFSLECAALPL